jgi:hypothetical protein
MHQLMQRLRHPFSEKKNFMLFNWLHTGFHLLSYLLPVDQLEYMAIRYNRPLTVALDFFFSATG